MVNIFWLVLFDKNVGKYGKSGRFPRRIWLTWGNTAQVDMAGLGPIGIMYKVSWEK